MPTYDVLRLFSCANEPLTCQSVIANRRSFQNREGEFPLVMAANDVLFSDGHLIQTRQDVFGRFDINDIVKFVLSVTYWGYNKNQRGIGYRVFESLESICDLVRYLTDHAELSRREYETSVIPRMNAIHGLSLSTFSKLFYFTGLSIDGHRCVILDNRVRTNLGHIHDARIIPLQNASSYRYRTYPDYLTEIESIANEFGCRPDQVEYALFLDCIAV